jgi:hypothetical protein
MLWDLAENRMLATRETYAHPKDSPPGPVDAGTIARTFNLYLAYFLTQICSLVRFPRSRRKDIRLDREWRFSPRPLCEHR